MQNLNKTRYQFLYNMDGGKRLKEMKLTNHRKRPIFSQTNICRIPKVLNNTQCQAYPTWKKLITKLKISKNNHSKFVYSIKLKYGNETIEIDLKYAKK